MENKSSFGINRAKKQTWHMIEIVPEMDNLFNLSMPRAPRRRIWSVYRLVRVLGKWDIVQNREEEIVR